MATNGLSKAEQAMLSHRSRQLEAADPRLCTVGGGDAKEIAALKQRLQDRLAPEAPDRLDAECAALLEIHKGTSWFELALTAE